MGFFSRAAMVIGNTGYAGMSVTGGILGGAYGAVSSDTSFIGGVVGGALLGAGLKAGAPRLRRAHGLHIRGPNIAKGGFGKRMASNTAATTGSPGAHVRAGGTSVKGTSMASNQGFTQNQARARVAASQREAALRAQLSAVRESLGRNRNTAQGFTQNQARARAAASQRAEAFRAQARRPMPMSATRGVNPPAGHGFDIGGLYGG